MEPKLVKSIKAKIKRLESHYAKRSSELENELYLAGFKAQGKKAPKHPWKECKHCGHHDLDHAGERGEGYVRCKNIPGACGRGCCGGPQCSCSNFEAIYGTPKKRRRK